MDEITIKQKPLKERIFFLSSFIIKLIAIISMTLDHIGIFLQVTSGFEAVGDILRYIGKLSFPLILFLIVEGAKYSKNQNKYLFRIGIMTIFIAIIELVIEYAMNIRVNNIFLQLFLVLISIILLKSKKIGIKLLAVIPFLYSLITTIIYCYELNTTLYFFSSALMPDYYLYGYAMGLLMFASTYLFDRFLQRKSGETNIQLSEIKDQYNYKLTYNSLLCLSIILIEIIFLFLKYVFPVVNMFKDSPQSYCVLACLFIFFYSHKLGFKNKIIQYGFYLYYPVHIALIYLIFQLISIL